LPFVLQSGESEFRIYTRLYSGGTNLDIGAMQIVKQMYSGVIIPTAGQVADSFTASFNKRVYSPSFTPSGSDTAAEIAGRTFTAPDGTVFPVRRHAMDGYIVPIFGSQQNVDVRLITFTMDATSEIRGMEFKYVATQDFSNPEAIPGAPDLFAYPPSGDLQLRVNVSGTWTTYTLATDIELNHARVSREWRRDIVNWELSSENGNVTFVAWFYGTRYAWSVKDNIYGGASNYTALSMQVEGYSTDGGAVLFAPT